MILGPFDGFPNPKVERESAAAIVAIEKVFHWLFPKQIAKLFDNELATATPCLPCDSVDLCFIATVRQVLRFHSFCLRVRYGFFSIISVIVLAI